jgi:hypothetical protein
MTQVFRNNRSTVIEAIYYVPLQKQATIHSFITCIDGREKCRIDLLKQVLVSALYLHQKNVQLPWVIPLN